MYNVYIYILQIKSYSLIIIKLINVIVIFLNYYNMSFFKTFGRLILTLTIRNEI